ncbi:hypothetical protein [Dactylosporangium sp. CA-139066]|uniref:phage terminase small subunit n=1 Tax=Dactylosporangium sp. CA-139066 TaxID=3239930 RepID=UPI003D919782
MAGNGFAPKEGGKHGNFVSDLEKPLETLTADGEVKAPTLPRYRQRHAQTRHWWDRWTRSPMAATFCETDWSRLVALAPVVDAFHRLTDAADVAADECNFEGMASYTKEAAKLLAEIRLNESLLGATHLDRLRGRIKIDREKPSADDGELPEDVAILNDYRKAVGG